MTSTFTQKHYEHLILALRRDQASPESKQRAVEILCRVFEQDNPKFRSDLFRSLTLMRETVTSETVTSVYMVSKWRDAGPRRYNVVTSSGDEYEWSGPNPPKIGDIVEKRRTA